MRKEDLSGRLLVGAVATLLSVPGASRAGVDYAIDDGTSERTLGIDSGEDLIWLNTFPIQPGGEIVTSISLAFGRPGVTQALDGLSITVLLYEDLDGGSPVNAVLRQSRSVQTANANTNIINEYTITPTEVHGTLIAAALFRNATGERKFIGATDQTLPEFLDRSYTGFAVGLDETNLASIPAAQFGTIESIGLTGNLIIRAHGVPIPEPTAAAMALCAIGATMPRRH